MAWGMRCRRHGAKGCTDFRADFRTDFRTGRRTEERAEERTDFPYGFLTRESRGDLVETGPQWVGGGRTENILSRAHFQLNLGRKWGPKKGSERCQKRVKQRGRMGVQGRGWGYV